MVKMFDVPKCNKHVRWLPLFFSDNAISFYFIQFVSFWYDLIWFGLVKP